MKRYFISGNQEAQSVKFMVVLEKVRTRKGNGYPCGVIYYNGNDMDWVTSREKLTQSKLNRMVEMNLEVSLDTFNEQIRECEIHQCLNSEGI